MRCEAESSLRDEMVAPPPPVQDDVPVGKDVSNASAKGNPLNIEEILARKQVADAAAAKVSTCLHCQFNP